MEQSKEIREEEAIKVINDLTENYSLEKMMAIIKDNKADFIYKEKKYRSRILNQQDKDELDLLRRKKYAELLQAKDDKGNPSFLFVKEIIKIYKERGVVDIEDLDNQIKKLWQDINDVRMKQGESLEKKEPENILKEYDNQINELLRKIQTIAYQKSIYLENSFERTLEHYGVKITSWLSLEKEENEKYIRAFEKIEDFLKADEELITISVSFSLAINYRV
jgi:hypothetical protein